MAEVVVVGSPAADVVLRVPELPAPGSKVVAEPLGWRLGGGSANVACGLAAAGHAVELVGPLGSDAVADALVAELRRRGVGTERLVRVERATTRALILLAPDGERTIVIVRASGPLPRLAFPRDPACVYIPSFARFPLGEAFPDALVVAAEPGPADVVIGAEEELPADFDAVRAVAGERLRWVVVTRGASGAAAYGPGASYSVPGRPAQQVDATGAGDAFAAGLIAGLLAGGGIEDALRAGAAAGAAAVEALQSVPASWLD